MHVEAVAAVTWRSDRYVARCLGVADVESSGETIESAVSTLCEALGPLMSAEQGLVGRPDRSGLWQPLPVEMITPVDVQVAP